jgi:hypothetical protein
LNPYDTYKLCCSPLKILVEIENSQNKLSYPYRKKILTNRKFICQKKVNSKFLQHVMIYIASPSRTPIHLKAYPNMEKYIWNLLVKFQLDSRCDLELCSIDGRKFYTKIRIWPYLNHITYLIYYPPGSKNTHPFGLVSIRFELNCNSITMNLV